MTHTFNILKFWVGSNVKFTRIRW